MDDDAGTIELSRDAVTQWPVWTGSSPPMAAPPSLDPRLEGFATRCAEFLALPRNWNSYRARPIEVDLVREALKLLAIAMTPEVSAPDVVPTASGGVQLEWHRPDRELEIEVRGLGHYRVYSRNRDEETEYDAFDDLSLLLPLIHAFRV